MRTNSSDFEPAPTPEVVLEAFSACFPGEAPTADQTAFVRKVMEDYRPGELPGVTAEDLAAAIAGFWRFAAVAPTAPEMRIVRALGADGRDLGLDLIEIVQPDGPFLVDTVMGEINESGARVLALFHPIVGAGSARTSTIQVWVAPLGESRKAPLLEGLRLALADARAAAEDFPAMLALLARSMGELARAAPGDPDDLAEDLAFLRWMDAGHFVFLGARSYVYPRTADGGYAAEEPAYDPGDSLGVLRDARRSVLRRASEPAVLAAGAPAVTLRGEPVVVAKSTYRSRVHRRAHMDYIAVRRYGVDGQPSGETRFVGLFTADAYHEPTRETPLLRRKVAQVTRAAGFSPGSHNGLRLANILETYPRDELFQIGPEELLATALDVLHLSDRPRVKLFARRDPFDRFVSVLLYAPRERYDERLRERAGVILAGAWNGRIAAYYPSFSDAPLARVNYVIDLSGDRRANPDPATLEAAIARLTRTWSDDLQEAVDQDTVDAAQASRLTKAYADAFPPGYRDRYDASEALADMRAIEVIAPDEDAIGVRAYRLPDDSPLRFRFKLYRRGAEPAALARVLPILQDMGLSALVEQDFAIRRRDPDGAPDGVWAHEFLLEDARGETLSLAEVKAPFEAAFQAVWAGQAESDGFNRLVLDLGIAWREAALVRALARYRHQSGLDPSQAVQAAAVASHPEVTQRILALFHARFDPDNGLDGPARVTETARLGLEIETALRGVDSLDHDRVLRRLAALVSAILRTNYYQRGPDGAPAGHISFKVASRDLIDLPAPKPFREIFVSAPQVQGVHLRFGPVARGGLRWSDRRDDFRTEVLGLVKAQQVKNAVIVPVGSKGGFYPMRPPRGGSPDAVRADAIAAYRIFLRGLLDITDNIDGDGKVAHPERAVLYDGEDPYLVVAADKGTATFSDIANGLAADYGFWLGDAFASGGSAGYDHKAMGITARGAWESVKRHFREMGKDIQTEPFTVVGVGDMSGDVFGNGMLLSPVIRLRAAFDHRHIFLDPEPDIAAAFAERRRLFDLPRSSWDDYDRAFISPGGGVFPRTLKAIPLSEPVRALLDVKAEQLSPAELISAILKSRTELLYLGGIGCYVKAAAEANLDVGDKANDAVRINGRELRCKVVGEGANLGFTQAGRIEFALAGGRIDTDAIDNSAGVDTSDHEVNIKILTGMAQRAGLLAPADRDPLLASMTDEIAARVLSHNYDQTLALTLLEADAAADLPAQDAFMRRLETLGRLDRGLEGLPDAAAIAARAEAGKGLTRPELAVLLAYGKLELFDAVIASDAPDDPWFEATLVDYFPRALAPFEDQMRRHRLRREIIATVIGNTLVNLLGPTFPDRLRAAAGCDTAQLITAFAAALRILRFEAAWARVAALDGQAPAAGQTALFRELAFVLRGQTYWLARRAARERVDVAGLIAAHQAAVDTLKDLVPAVLSPFEQKAAVRRAAGWIKAGAPKDVAHSVALMRPLNFAALLADLAAARGWPLADTAQVYHKVGGQFGFDRLRAIAAERDVADPYERLATRRLIEDMLQEQSAVAAAVMTHAGPPGDGEDPARGAAVVSAWSSAHTPAVRAARRALEEIEAAPGGWTFAKLTIANAALRRLAEA